MRSARTLPAVLLAGSILAASAGACIDLSPVDYQAPEAGVAADGGAGARDGASQDALASACHDCLAGPLCSAPYEACQANAVCAKFTACATATLCWNSSLTNLANLSPCLVQCSVSAGVTSQNDPAALLISPLYTCAQDPLRCGPACAPGADQ